MFTKAERDDAKLVLRNLIKPGDTIYTTVVHVSRSGMQRSIKVIVQADDGPGEAKRVVNISWTVARALGWSFDSRWEAVKVGGCGMDMCFHTVYSLGRTLFPDGGPLELSPREAQERRSGAVKEVDGGYLLKYRDL